MPAGADELKPLVDATAGATGALLTNIMLSPVDIAKTRMQTGRSKDGVLETIREEHHENVEIMKQSSVNQLETISALEERLSTATELLSSAKAEAAASSVALETSKTEIASKEISVKKLRQMLVSRF